MRPPTRSRIVDEVPKHSQAGLVETVSQAMTLLSTAVRAADGLTRGDVARTQRAHRSIEGTLAMVAGRLPAAALMLDPHPNGIAEVLDRAETVQHRAARIEEDAEGNSAPIPGDPPALPYLADVLDGAASALRSVESNDQQEALNALVDAIEACATYLDAR